VTSRDALLYLVAVTVIAAVLCLGTFRADQSARAVVSAVATCSCSPPPPAPAASDEGDPFPQVSREAIEATKGKSR
jgi:hypothetical protein